MSFKSQRNMLTSRFNDNITQSTTRRRTSKIKRKGVQKHSKELDKQEVQDQESLKAPNVTYVVHKEKHGTREKRSLEQLAALPSILQCQSGCIARISQATVTLVIRVKENNKSDRVPTQSLSVDDQRSLVTKYVSKSSKSASIATDPLTSCNARWDGDKKDGAAKTGGQQDLKLERVIKWCESSFGTSSQKSAASPIESILREKPTLQKRAEPECLLPSRRSTPAMCDQLMVSNSSEERAAELQVVTLANAERSTENAESIKKNVECASSDSAQNCNLLEETRNVAQAEVTVTPASDSNNDAVTSTADSTTQSTNTVGENAVATKFDNSPAKDIQDSSENDDEATSNCSSSAATEESPFGTEEDSESDTNSEYTSDASGSTLMEDWSSSSDNVSDVQPQNTASSSYPRAPIRPVVVRSVVEFRRINRMASDSSAVRDNVNAGSSAELIQYQAHLMS